MASAGLGVVTRWGKVPAWWLLHDGMDADRFCVMAAMATYADEAGMCDPSQATLARHLKRSRPWVNRIVAELAELGFVEKTGRVRRNGGTTSCLYRLLLVPHDEPVAPETPGVSREDAPCHAHDTSQQQLEHSHTRPPRAAAGEPATAPTEAAAELPSDWRPSEADLDEAFRLCPDADLEAHTARFRARCRAKGYRYRPSGFGAAWLAWLLEDLQRTGGSPGARPRASSPHRRASSQAAEQPALRYTAWGHAASCTPAARS